MDAHDLRNLYSRQARWFAAERGRLLRQAGIAARRRVLDLGTGTGETLDELRRRCGGEVIGLDRDAAVLRLAGERGAVVRGDARQLPFPDGHFDLVFAQMFFLWARDLDRVCAEVRRVLEPGGCLLAAAEPDYGGLIEHPGERGPLRALAAQLEAEGADARVARRLGGVLRRAGFDVVCGLHPARPLEAGDPASDFHAPAADGLGQPPEFAFVPYFHFLARRTR